MLKLVYSALNELDASFLKDLLIEEGIEAVVQGEALEQVWGTLPLAANSVPSVWVPQEQAPRAEPIVAEYNRRHKENQERPSRLRPTWTCLKCGEKVEEQFTQCWKCGTMRIAPESSHPS